MKSSLALALFLSSGFYAIAAPAAITAPAGSITLPAGASSSLSTPVGMITERLRPGMNLIGLRLHQPSKASGQISAIGADYAELASANEEKTGPLKLALSEGRTYVLDLAKNDNPKLADQVWVADANGAFAIYYLNQSGQWAAASNRTEAAAKVPVGSAILVDRKGPAALFCLGD